MATSSLRFPKRALLIGNNDYDVNKLQRCKNDAEDVANQLERLGFEATSHFNLKYMGMTDKINDFLANIMENDLIVFFFSGHGTEWHENNYLIPIDNKALIQRPDRHQHLAVSSQTILESMKKKNPFAIVFLLDCCRVHSEGTKDLPVPSDSTIASTIKGVAGSLVVFAYGPNENAFDRSPNTRNSLFTYHLLKHIGERNLKIDEIMCRVCDGVYEDSAGQLYTYRLSSLQTSQVYFNFTTTGTVSL
ncbi:unnamed protein product [Rotaria sp. Silwood1]|nr:unnamed protein product [Rotaria sp. Silwood1]CAF1491158.1 unnamed protein product [Rotaria sp. Silwood1]CAF1684152.1 unnamed protein product [Rotaria sp. Silwood1]CAF1684158.1 unnamed protein product [Rotaria sp. Silwood1]